MSNGHSTYPRNPFFGLVRQRLHESDSPETSVLKFPEATSVLDYLPGVGEYRMASQMGVGAGDALATIPDDMPGASVIRTVADLFNGAMDFFGLSEDKGPSEAPSINGPNGAQLDPTDPRVAIPRDMYDSLPPAAKRLRAMRYFGQAMQMFMPGQESGSSVAG